jgi:outer membrane protein assembly factor BamA
MSARRLLTVGIALLLFASGSARAQTPAIETLGEVRVHGNHTTPDADVLALAGLTVGAQVTDDLLQQAAAKLRSSGRFDDVEVRKRFRSIDNPSDILVILLVDEHATVSQDDLMPGPLKRLRGTGMWLPIVNYADGYGFTYGARVSFVDTLGPRSRISVPATWGGDRRIGVDAERTFDRGPFTRVAGGVSISRRVNPHFDIADTRREARLRAERALTTWLRVGGGARITNVRFGELDEQFVAQGIGAILDTRTDPSFPRNAIHVVAGVEQLRFDAGRRVARWSGDARGYVGLFGKTVLALRAAAIRASDPLPAYEQALLGGDSQLRGYAFGYRAGDNLTALSAEVRVPLNSPLDFGRLGVKGFVDFGTVYQSGAKLADQRFDRGIGGGVFLTAPIVSLSLDVAWPNDGSRKPRWHFGLGVSF